MLSLTLAAGWEEVIGVSIALVIFIGNMLAKGLKKTNEQSQQSSAKPKPTATQRTQRLEELAAKRRAELQQLAGQRQPQTQRPPTSRPDNLTVQQSSERDQAKTLYERRAEALRQMQQKKQSPQAPPSRPQPQTQRSAPQSFPSAAQRQHDLSKVREHEKQLERQRQLAEQQRELQRRQKAQQLGSGVLTVSNEKHGDIQTVHRHVEDILEYEPIANSRTIPALGGMKIDRRSLKQAIVLKEILDPPLALRKSM